MSKRPAYNRLSEECKKQKRYSITQGKFIYEYPEQIKAEEKRIALEKMKDKEVKENGNKEK